MKTVVVGAVALALLTSGCATLPRDIVRGAERSEGERPSIGGGTWVYPNDTQSTVAQYPPDTYGPGTYLVGEDIQPGDYKTAGPAPGGGVCYWSRLSATDGEPGSIIANGTSEGPAVITIKPSDRAVNFQLGNCIWTKK